jgi:cobalt-zinc-cadmium efflux system protein
VQIEDVALSECKQILQRLNGMLCDRFSIHHTTVQFEHVVCAVAESGCVIPSGTHSHNH